MLAGTSTTTIKEWRRKCGIKAPNNGWGSNQPTRPFVGTKLEPKVYEIVPKEIWDNPGWFYQKYVVEELGVHALAKMIDRDIKIVLSRLKRFGIQTRTTQEAVKSKNKCCTREWLEEHYVIYGYSLRKCAELAGVNRYTIYNWLVKYNIYIRDRYDAVSGELGPSYGRKNARLSQYHTKKNDTEKAE
jgi:transposase-like protein